MARLPVLPRLRGKKASSPFFGIAALLAIGCSFGIEETNQLPQCVDGWKIEVVAESPQVKHPSVVCCAPDGRVFVAEDPMDISTPTADLPHGRILCFFPDGTRKVFADQLYAVFGMQYIDGYLYVLHNPKFSRFRDEKGVGVDRIDLIEQTHPKPWDLDWNDHVPSNFRLAMDGYLYVAVGDKGLFGAVGRDGSRVDLHGGGILRLRPDGTELEIYCTGVRNILDVALDSDGEIFTYDNTDEHAWMGRLTHMVDGGFYGYPYDFQPQQPNTLWMMADFGGGAATGTLCYEEDALPTKYRGNLFLSDFGKRQILRVEIARDGGTFKVVSREDMFLNPPGGFRPVGIALAPDGTSIYICDWNHTDTKEVVECGRLLRLTYAGSTSPTEKPAWYLSAAMGEPCTTDTNELIKGLSHPAMSVRLVAQRRLSERGAASQDKLVALLRDADASTLARAHALWALDAIDRGEGVRDFVGQLARSGDVRLRRQAIRQLGTRRVVGASELLIECLRDKDASIRFQAATALGRIADPLAIASLIEALDEQDLFARFAVFTALHRIGRSAPSAWPEIVAGLRHEKAAVREGVAMATRNVWNVNLVEALVRSSADLEHHPTTRAKCVEILTAKLYRPPAWNGQWWAYHPALKSPPSEKENWEATVLIVSALRERVTDNAAVVRLAAVVGLRQAADVDAKSILRQALARETNTEVRGELISALGDLRDSDAEPLIVSALTDRKTLEVVRLAAITATQQMGTPALRDALLQYVRTSPLNEPHAIESAARTLGQLKMSEAVGQLVQLLHHEKSEVRLAAIEALSHIANDEAVEALSGLIDNVPMEMRLAAITALGEIYSAHATESLLRAYEQTELRDSALGALARQPNEAALDAYLDGLASHNADLRHQCREAIRAIRVVVRARLEERTKQLSNEVIARLQDIYRDDAEARAGPLFAREVAPFDPAAYTEFARLHLGNFERGREAFHNTSGLGCVKCHVVNGTGGRIGPDLSTIGEQFDRVQLAEHVVYPSKSIREGYRQVQVLLDDGRQFVGIVAGETTQEIVLRDTQGKDHLLTKSEIEERRNSDQSLMPERIVESISPETFADLISYLETLRRRGSR